MWYGGNLYLSFLSFCHIPTHLLALSWSMCNIHKHIGSNIVFLSLTVYISECCLSTVFLIRWNGNATTRSPVDKGSERTTKTASGSITRKWPGRSPSFRGFTERTPGWATRDVGRRRGWWHKGKKRQLTWEPTERNSGQEKSNKKVLRRKCFLIKRHFPSTEMLLM